MRFLSGDVNFLSEQFQIGNKKILSSERIEYGVIGND